MPISLCQDFIVHIRTVRLFQIRENVGYGIAEIKNYTNYEM